MRLERASVSAFLSPICVRRTVLGLTALSHLESSVVKRRTRVVKDACGFTSDWSSVVGVSQFRQQEANTGPNSGIKL